MQIVIDIEDEIYRKIMKDRNQRTLRLHESIIANGIPLDKIRAEIERQEKWLLQAGCTAYNVDIAFDAIKSAVGRGDVE